MRKNQLLILVSIILMSHMTTAKTLKILHYNIKELTTLKLDEQDAQLNYVKNIINKFNPDILSLNEIQYDTPKVPLLDFESNALNLQKFKTFMELNKLNDEVFTKAITGENAQRKANGEYFADESDPESRKFADQVNYGLFPGQYSTGALFHGKKISQTVVKNLKWKDFNPSVDLSKYKTPAGENFPEDMALFDKNFTDALIEVEGVQLHLVLLHATPAFGFGNDLSPNLERNADQVRFLRWYLTGVIEDGFQPPTHLKHLTKNDKYLAMGDFNVDREASNPGSPIIKSLIELSNLWVTDPIQTQESSNFSENPFSLQLDYIFYQGFKLKKGLVYKPESKRIDLGCDDQEQRLDDFVLVEYRNRDKTCHALVHKDYYELKMASDHFPLYLELEI